MSVKRQIPNTITGLNLISGCLAIIQILNGELYIGAIFILIGAFFDFFDGLSARLLKVSSDMGKQMDSLADMVTFGVAPSLIVFKILENNNLESLKYFALIIAFFSAFRLAKFNIDTRQSSTFIGLPTPANALFWLSIPLSLKFNDEGVISELITNKYFVLIFSFLLSIFLVSEIPMFSLKFKSLKFKENKTEFSFIFISIILILFFHVQAILFIILAYIIFSIFKLIIIKKNKD